MVPRHRILIFLAAVAGFLLIGACLIGLYLFWAINGQSPFRFEASLPTLAPDEAVVTDRGNYRTENNWIAAMIAQEIAGMVWLAQHPDQPVPAFKVQAQVDPQKALVHLELTGWSDQKVSADLNPSYAWDPKAYSDFAHQLLGDTKRAEPASDAPNALADLLTPTGKVLAENDVEISQELLQNPASVGLHEKAALLLLTLALRENAYLLSDARLSICRATAHLALARAMEGSEATSFTGKVADVTLRTVAGREVDASQQIDLLKAQSDAPAPVADWVQALSLLNKQDWRIVSPSGTTPLLVKLTWFRVVALNADDALATTHLDQISPLEEVPDWGRSVLSGNRISVEGGHRFCGPTITAEFEELKSILVAENDPVPAHAPLSDVFNELVGSSVTPDAQGKNTCHVIGVDLFKDISDRHVIAAIWTTHLWMKDEWGVPDEDAKFVQQMRSLFHGTRREGYLSVILDDPTKSGIPPSGSLRVDVAEMPPPFAYHLNWANAGCHFMYRYFNWGIPLGCPFDIDNRVVLTYDSLIMNKDKDKVPNFQDLSVLAPNSYDIASWQLLMNDDLHIPNTLQNERAVLERFFDYDVHACVYFRQLAQKQPDFDGAQNLEILRKEAALDPDENFPLGDALAAQGKTEEAVEAWRQGAAKCIDLVGYANSIQPLVAYDFDHGQTDVAEKLAQKAAEVYSEQGIQTYIWLLCKLNRFDEAEEWARKVQERYGGDELETFYVAHADHFTTQSGDIVKKFYPDGLPTVSLTDFNGPPTDGCVFRSNSTLLENAGLRVGDVVVALDSHPVHSEKTYMFIRAMKDAPEMDFIIWRNGAYSEIKASPPGRRFGNNIGDYTPSPN